MKKLLILISMIFILGSCVVPSSFVKTQTDEFTDSTKQRMESNRLKREGFFDTLTVSVNLQKFKQENITLYSVIVEYRDSGWLFIQKGKSLTFLLDNDQRIILSSDEGSLSRRNIVGHKYSHVTEEAWYDITPKQIRKIAYANEVKVKIEGRTSYITREFCESNIENFRQFYEEYVK